MRITVLSASLVSLVALATLLCTAGTAAATPAFSLRVEAPGQTLDPGTFYAVRDPLGVQRGQTPASGTCERAPGDLQIGGRTALGVAVAASNGNAALRPLLVVEDSFGKRVCRIDGFNETDSPFTGWLYRVNHVAPTTAADLAPIQTTDEVLWVFANFGTGANTGDELVLAGPFRTTPGAVQVSVASIAFDGTRTPAPDGTVVNGGAAPATTVSGVATVPVTAGQFALRAVGPGPSPTQIPSNELPLCVALNINECPPVAGRRIVGTNVADRFKGTPGRDQIRTRGGKDKIKVRGGSADVVNCGSGKDKVVADAADRVKRCERVRLSGGAGRKKKA